MGWFIWGGNDGGDGAFVTCKVGEGLCPKSEIELLGLDFKCTIRNCSGR